MNKISKFLILLGSIAIILYAMNKWVYPIESSYTCDSDRIKELAKESISREKLLDHLILGEAGIERIYDIQEISSKDGKRLCRALIDTGSIFPGLEMEEYKLKGIEFHYAIKEDETTVHLGSVFTDEGYNEVISQVVKIYNNH